MENFSSRRITRIGLIAAMYAVMTIAIAPIAYGSVQFRVSEALMLLCFYNRDHIASLSIGCFIANMFSTIGIIDTIVGTSATVAAGICIYLFRKEGSSTRLLLCSLFPVIFNALFVGAEITILSKEPISFFMTAASIALGELICVTVIGTTLFKILERNKAIMTAITEKY
ncbi:QueT transporter family protein [Ruminococcus sp. NK3A76]|uniref:QueT transporter family protein n=1 Tax=Ruminococcus sp. NK3A76 TaxID=877411 RepID=UPI00048E3B9E|nr:QueT transporter family protein [Ruminococcus sp. NK3A76]